MLQQDAEGIARLRARIAEAPDRARWAALEHCLDDHHARIVDVVLAALSPAIDARLMTRLRLAMHGDDQRHRASAFELVAAGPASRLIPGAVALLRFLLFERAAGRLAGSARDRLPDQAMASLSPWVRRAASLAAMRPALSDRTLHPARGAGSFEHRPAGDPMMEMDDQEFERIVALKRTPPFRHVPFETLIEVARSVQARLYLAGEQVITDGLGGQVLLILEAGVLAIGDGAGARQIQGPDCFGEAAVAGEPMPWPRIVAVEDSRVSFLRAAVFQELCEEHPEMALELCRLLARRLREAGAGAP
jgi:hypothetical protein